MIGPRAYHVWHPELTEMQLFLRFWYVWPGLALGVGIVLVIGNALDKT